MTDNIFNNSFVSTQVEWHKLGVKVEQAMTSEEAIKLAKLDFNVRKAPAYAKFDPPININPDQAPCRGKLIPDTYCTVREDLALPLGIVGKDYTIVQPIECFDWFDNVVGNKEAMFQTAGVLDNSKTVFVTAKLPVGITVLKDDLIEQYLLLSNSFDGSSSLIVKFTPIRVVCANTLAMALTSKANTVRLRHSKNVKEKLKMASTVLGIQREYKIAIEETLLRLAQIKLNEKEVLDVTNKLILDDKELILLKSNNGNLTGVTEISTRKKNTLFELNTAIDNAIGQDKYRGSALWVYNGVTSYLQNVKTYPDAEKKMDSLLFGTGDKMANKALNMVLSY